MRSAGAATRERAGAEAKGLEAIASQAGRAVLNPVGATLIARDNVVGTVRTYTRRRSAERELQKLQRRVDLNLRKFERRGNGARDKLRRDLKRTRTQFERELRQRRRQVGRLVQRNSRTIERRAERLGGGVSDFADSLI